jgi:tetratricopeptide (TPR) repeat protein
MESRRLWRRQILLYVYTIGFALSIIAVFIVGRYRLEALLPMLVWSGPAAAGLAHVVWEQRWLNLTLRALALATGIGLLWPHGSPAARYNALVSPAGAQLVRPNDYDRLAVAYQKMGQRKEAVKLLEEALTAYPGFSLLTLRLADVHIEEGKKERAAAVLERFMANGWSDPLATRYLASIYATTGRAPQAVSLLQDHLRANPQDDQARTLLSQIQGGGK